MRLLLLTNDFPSPWLPGRGTFNLETARALSSDHDVQVVNPISWVDESTGLTPQTSSAVTSRREIRDGITVYYPRYFYPPKIGRNWYHHFYRFSVRKALNSLRKNFKPQAVLAYWSHPDGTTAVDFAHKSGIPAFVMTGGSDVLCVAASSNSRRRKISDTLKAADGVIVVGTNLKKRVIELGVPEDRVHVFYRGVDRTRFFPGEKATARATLGLSSDSPIFLWVGRLAPVKGAEIALKAVQRLCKQGKTLQLLMIGDGPERSRLEKFVRDAGLQSHVRFLGEIPHHELPDWFRSADWTLLTSHSEGVPNVLLESHACGTPFVATSVGDVPEIAIDGIDRLIPAADFAELACTMAEVGTALTADQWAISSRVPDSRSAVQIISRVIASVSDRRKRVVSNVAGPDLSASPRSNSVPNPVRQLIRRTLPFVLPRKMLLISGTSRSRKIALTFDDGPHPVHTPQLLDRLAELDLKATFFVIGQEAERYPHIVRRIVAEGHALGNHTWSHPKMLNTSVSTLIREVGNTSRLLSDITGQSIRLFRPPNGKLTVRQLISLWNHLRQSVILWNKDPKDYECRTTEEAEIRVQSLILQGGDLCLLHDNCRFVSSFVSQIATQGRLQGLVFATVNDLLGDSEPKTPDCGEFPPDGLQSMPLSHIFQRRDR